MSVNSLPKTVTRQCRGCDLNPGPSAPESSTLTTTAAEPPVAQAKTEHLGLESLNYRVVLFVWFFV